MRKLLTGFAGAVGAAALWRFLTRKPRPAAEGPPAVPAPAADTVAETGPDPAEELRRKLAEARDTVDDRDEFDAAEGTPVDQVEEPPPLKPGQPEEPHSLEERRRAVHQQAQDALDRMQQEGDE